MLFPLDNDRPHSLGLTAADMMSGILDFSGNIKVIGWEGEELGTSASTKPKKRKGHPNLLGMPMTKLLLTTIASLRSRLQGLCCPVPRQMSPGHLHKGP